MKVILTEKVRSLGNVGEIVNVSAGHARNFLIPGKLAVLADENNKKFLAEQQKRLAKKIAEQRDEALGQKKKIDGQVIELFKRVSGSGTLFGTVTTAELVKELKQKGAEVERRQIVITTPIKQLGTHDVTVKVFTDVEAQFQVKVEMDLKQAKELKEKQAAAEKRAKAKKDAPQEEAATEEVAEQEGDADSETTENAE